MKNSYSTIAHYVSLFLLLFSINFLGLLIGFSGYVIMMVFSIFLVLYTLLLTKSNLTGFKFQIILFYLVFISLCLAKNIPFNYTVRYIFDASLVYYLIKIGDLKYRKIFILLVTLNVFSLFFINFFSSNERILLAIFSGGEDAINGESGLNRFQGLFGAPGSASLYLSLLFIYFLNCLKVGISRYINLFFLFLTIALGLYTGNRSFIISVSITSLLFLFTTVLSHDMFSIFKIKNFVFFTLIIFLIFFLMRSDIFNLIYLGFSQRFDSGFENRMSGENGFIELISDMSFYDFLFGAAKTINDELHIVVSGNKYQPHNVYFFLLSGFGLLPFIFSLVIIANIVYTVINKMFLKSVFISVSILGTLLLFSFSEVFFLAPIQVLFILLVTLPKVSKIKVMPQST
jgi:hypothetical protein